MHGQISLAPKHNPLMVTAACSRYRQIHSSLQKVWHSPAQGVCACTTRLHTSGRRLRKFNLQAIREDVLHIPHASVHGEHEDKYIMVCGRRVSLEEGRNDHTRVVFTGGACMTAMVWLCMSKDVEAVCDATGRSVKPEDITPDILEDMLTSRSTLIYDQLMRALTWGWAHEDLLKYKEDLQTNRNSNSNYQSHSVATISGLFCIASTSKETDISSCIVTSSYAESYISKLSLPVLSHIITVLVAHGLCKAALQIVQFAVKSAPSDALLQSWQNTLQNGINNATDKAAVLAALQPVQLSNATLMADAARLRYRRGEREEALADLAQIIALNPDDSQCLARQAWMKAYSGDFHNVVADLKRAEQISPLQDFDYLKLLGEHTSNENTAHSVTLFDRALCAKPAHHPARLAYARIYQQRGACMGTLQQFPAAIEDLQMAVKLGLHNAKTFMYMSGTYLAMNDFRNAVRYLDKAIFEEPEDQALVIVRAQVMHDMQDRRAAEADFRAAEALGPLPDDVALERQQMRAGTWELGRRSYKSSQMPRRRAIHKYE